MSVYFDPDKKRFRFDFSRRINGRRYRVTKLLPQGWSRAQAEAYDRAQGGSLYAQASGVVRPRLSLAGAVKLYLDHRLTETKRGKQTAQELAHLFDFIAKADLEDAPQVAIDYRKANPHLSRSTIWKRLCMLKAAIRYAFKWHAYGEQDYSARMIIPPPNPGRQVYAKLPALNKLWRAFEDADARALFKMAFYMGLRWRSELLPRTKGDIHRARGDMWLRVGTTKNGDPRMVPAHPAIRDCLKFIPFEFGESYYANRWHAALKLAGLPKMVPHDLRHSLASEIASRGGTLIDIGAALDHKSISSSKRYTHLYEERVHSVLMGVGQKVTTRKPKSSMRRRV